MPATTARRHLALVTALALISLGALGSVRPTMTAATWSRGDDVALVVAWAIAVVASAWLLVASGACVLALSWRRPRLARRLAAALPRVLRGLVESAIVGSCLSLAAVPAHASAPLPVPTLVLADQPVVRALAAAAPTTTTATTATTGATTTTRTLPATDTPPTTDPLPTAGVPAPRTTTVTPPARRRPVAAPALATPPEHAVVRPGDNLWLIARAALVRASARQPGEAEIARYWRLVIAANRSTLRSGDPSLVFPGEVVTLPPRPGVS